MTRRLLLILTLLVAVMMPSHAVFDEKNIDQSIRVLDNELRDKFVNIGKQNQLQRDRTKHRIEMMAETTKKANIVAMMLYSQKVEYIFGITYASNMAAELYQDFVKNTGTLMEQADVNTNDVARCDSIIKVMNRINPATLSSEARKNRLECIYWAKLIKVIESKRETETKRGVEEYKKTLRFLKELNQYAQNRYKYVQDKMFHNGSETFLFIVEHWDDRWPYLRMVTLEELDQADDPVISDWSVPVRLELMASFILLALVTIFFGWLIARLILRSDVKNPFFNYIKEWPRESHTCFILTCSAILFAITVNIARTFVTDQMFLVMALDLMGAFSWIVAVTLLAAFFTTRKFIKGSAEARIDGETSKKALAESSDKAVQHTMYLYLPLLLSGLFIILLRVNLFPNLVVAFLLPPLMLTGAIVEPLLLWKAWKKTGRIDRVLASLTELFLVILVFCSWNGYILLTVQILTWWLMQLTGILILTSIGIYMRDYAIYSKVKTKPIYRTWPYYFICMIFCPIGAIYSFLLSAYWAGAVFNIDELVTEVLDMNLLADAGATISLGIIIDIIMMWFIARFAYFVCKQVVMKVNVKHGDKFDQGTHMMYAKLLQIFIYGMWFLHAMFVLNVSMEWIAAAWAGLVTGMGFASKTILENIFYGISLLSGRLKIGDLIKVGDVYGRVLDISYSSTVIRADDGTVVAFTNEQLFAKNYRNLTHNKEFNKHILPFNIGMKDSIEEVRKIILEATATLPCLHLDEKVNGKPAHTIAVQSKGVGSSMTSSFIMMQVVFWVNPYTEKADQAAVSECVINALRKNNIELS